MITQSTQKPNVLNTGHSHVCEKKKQENIIP